MLLMPPLILYYGRFSAAVVVEIAYGHEVKSSDDEYVELAEKSNDILLGLGDTSLIDLFPKRKFHFIIGFWTFTLIYTFHIVKYLPAWFPGAWFVRYGQGPFLSDAYASALLSPHQKADQSRRR